ncbi:hypothetical protein ACUH92_08885 [Dermabacteraceae bacterium CCM 9520]
MGRVFEWLLRHPRIFLSSQLAVLVFFLLLSQALPAFAEGGKGGSLGTLDFKDSSGHYISSYSIDYLLDVLSTSVFKNSTLALLIGIVWEGYKWMVGAAAALIDFTLNFSWVPYIAGPGEKAASAVQGMLDRVPALRSLLLLITVGIGLSKIYFGKASKGISEILFAFLAVMVAAAFVVNPVHWLNEKEGPLEFVKSTGQEVSSTLIGSKGNKHLTNEEAVSSLSVAVVDVFVRKPHQFIAYGSLVEGTDCEKTYNENLNKTPNELANAMLSCDEDSYRPFIKEASFTSLIAVVIIFAGGFVVLALASLLSLFTLYEVANLVIGGVFLVWQLFRAVGPGGAYRGVINSFLGMIASILGMLLSIIVLVIYLTIVIEFFNAKQDSIITMFLIIDMLLIVGIVMLIKFRGELAKKLEESKKLFGEQGGGVSGPAKVLRRGTQAAAGLVGARYLGKKLEGKASAGQREGDGLRGQGEAGSALPKRSPGQRAGSAVTAPVRGVSRKLSRPGRAEVRRFRKANKASGNPLKGKEKKRAEALIYARAAKRKNAKQEQKLAKRQERTINKAGKRAWSWSAARKKEQAVAQALHDSGKLSPRLVKKYKVDTGSKMPPKLPKRKGKK